MSQPGKWFLGLIPIAGLVLLASSFRQGGVEADLVARANAGLAASGLSWAKVEMHGRDAIVTGEAPDPGLRPLAISAADRVFGVRQVGDKMSVLPEVKPFVFNAVRDGARLVLTGYVADAAARAAVVNAAKKAIPDAVIVDELKIARGASAAFAGATAFGVAELGKLGNGTLNISDSTLSLTGRALDLPKFADVKGKLAALPAGMSLGKGLAVGDILPPIVKPFGFIAEKTASTLILTGYVPNEAARTALVSAANALGKPVSDRLQVADGAPAGDWESAGRALIGELSKLTTGKAVLEDAKASISGVGMSGVSDETVKNDLKALPSGYALIKADIETGAIRPYTFQAMRADGRLALSGYVPDAKSRDEILNHAKRFFEGDTITNTIVEGAGAPKDFLNAAKASLQDLARLLPGSSLQMSDSTLTLKGLAAFDGARDQIAAQFRRNAPGGYTAAVDISTAALPAPALPPECQILYRDALSRAAIRFRTASADLSEDSAGLLDRLVVVTLRCQTAKIEIGGHTDSDGSPQANADLSRRRAEAVASYFVRAGISAEQFEPVGFGETKPVAPNDSAENKAKNRRIEFVVK